MHILQGQRQKSQRSHIMWFLNKLQVGNVFTQCVGKSNPTSHGLHCELLSTFYFIVRFFPCKVCYPFYLSCHYFGPPTLYSHSLTGLQNLACDVFLQEYIHIYCQCVCVCKYFTMQAVVLTFKLLLVSVIFSVLLLLWGV